MATQILVTYRIPPGYHQVYHLAESLTGYSVTIAVDEHRRVVMETRGTASKIGRTLADQWIIAAMGQIQQECVSLNLYQGCE
jgi:hypothetical protein